MKRLISMLAGLAIALAAVGCSGGGEPSGENIRDALVLLAASTVGSSPQVVKQMKEQIGEVKVVSCKKADEGGYRCTWTSPQGGGTGRLVKDGEVWKLVAIGAG